MITPRPYLRLVSAIIAGLGLAGCAAEAGPQLAQPGAQPIGASATASRSMRVEVERRLAKPLSVDDAIFIALVNNRAVRRTYYGAGLLDRDLERALDREPPAAMEAERHFVLATVGQRGYPWASEVDRRKSDELKVQVAAEQLRLAAEVRKAYAAAIAAAQIAAYLAQARDATEAALELTRRGARIGNWPKVNELREQVFHLETTAQLARAGQSANAAREQLTRLLGLWGRDAGYVLPARLPDLPAAPRAESDIEAIALRQRLDLQAAQIDIVADAREMELGHYGDGALLTESTRFTVLDEVDYFGADNIRGDQVVRRTQIPIFDRAQSQRDSRMLAFMMALDRYAEMGVMVRSEVREAYIAYRTSYDIAKNYRDEVLPLRRQIGEEMVYRYNGMLASVFELLTDAREQIAAVVTAVEAQRDYLAAEADLRLALTTGGVSSNPTFRMSRAAGGGGGH